MDVLLEKIITYSSVAVFLVVIVWIYVSKQKRDSRKVEAKIAKAKEDGIHEPVTLHPVIDPNSCIKSGACITACPEKDIIGIKDGKATIINGSRCIGHGACFHACPVQAITLCIGTEKRGVDLPHVNMNFETNVSGVYISGEMGGMGLIKNAVEQGKQAVDNLAKHIDKNIKSDYDLIIIGAGPAGISASLQAKKLNLKTVTFEQDSLGGTVYTFPRSKIVMTSAMDLPLRGKVRLYETSKQELLDIWTEVISKHEIEIREKTKIEAVIPVNNHFEVTTIDGNKITARKVLLSIGRRGTPRKLNVPGEESMKVAYRLLEPEDIEGKDILIVGGGDSAVESAMLLSDKNRVTLSYRKDTFSRIKPKNDERIKEVISAGKVNALFNSNVLEIYDDEVQIKVGDALQTMKNNLVYIFAGGELPTQFLEKIGITITTKFGDAILKHEKKRK